MEPLFNLWRSESIEDWQRALAGYGEAIERQGVKRLPELERWYRDELPASIRAKSHVTRDELVKLTEWKMARGTWRARNLALVRSNEPGEVVRASTVGLAKMPHPTAPIAELAKLAGVGPATASAVASAANPALYPFFDEEVAAQVPALGKLAFTLGYYSRYAAALRARAEALGGEWSATSVERALWACRGTATFDS